MKQAKMTKSLRRHRDPQHDKRKGIRMARGHKKIMSLFARFLNKGEVTCTQ